MNIYNTHDMPVQCTHTYMSVYDYNTTIQYKLPMYKHKPKHKQGIIVDVPGNICLCCQSVPEPTITISFSFSQYQSLSCQSVPVPTITSTN